MPATKTNRLWKEYAWLRKIYRYGSKVRSVYISSYRTIYAKLTFWNQLRYCYFFTNWSVLALSCRYQRSKVHPRTPDIRQVCSKRSWDGQIRKWRRLLHEFDPPKDEDEEDPDQMVIPRREQDRSTEYVEDTLMDIQSEYVEDPHLKIYDGWSDDEC